MSDIKALVRRVRSAGSAVAKEGHRLQAKGETLEADALAESVQELMAATETLERWRLQQAEALRLLADWLDPESAAQELGEIAQQLDPRDQEENDHA